MLLIASASCALTYSVLAQLVTKSVGVPKCNPFDDLQGNHCFELACDASPDSYSNYKICDGKPIDASLLSTQLCEIVPSAGTLQSPISCHTNQNSISYTWVNNEGIEEVSIANIICPHSCQKCAVEPNTLGLCPEVLER